MGDDTRVGIRKRYGRREGEKGKSDGKRDSANRLESQQSYRTTVKGNLPMGKGMKEVSRKEVE